MKPFKMYLTWALVMLAFVTNAQPWTYDFGTTTAAAFSSLTASTTYLPAPAAGTARVRCGTATTAAGSFTLANPGEALGTGSELQMLSNAGSASTTKFSVYDYTAGNTGYLKFKITLNGGTNGVYTCWVGDGVNFSDNLAMTNAQIFAGLRWSLGASNAVTYTVSGSTGTFGATGISNSTSLFVQNLATSYSLELYMNNSAASTTYGRSSINYTVASGTWDLWVDGVLVGNDLAKAGLGSAANFDSFAFNHQVSASAPGRIYLDDIEYSNALPAPAPCTAPATQASDITFPGNSTNTLDVTWSNGDGGGRVVYMNSTNSFTAPTNGSNPTANLAWANAGQQCVFNGSGSGPITVTGLLPSTTYHFAVYEYCTPTRNYSTATGTANPNSQSTAAGASLSVNSLTAFGSQCIGGNYGPNSFNVTGVNLTAADVSIGALAGYTYSTSSTGPFTPTLAISQPGGSFSQDVYVQFSPAAAIAYNGNITVGGGGASNQSVAVSGAGIAPGIATLNTPTSADLAATTITLGANIASTNCSDVTLRGIEWSTTNGFADGAGTPVSESGIFGIGVYTTAVTGLQPNTTYYWKAFVTNAAGTTYTAQQTFVTAQEYLAAGNISILGINSTAPDNFCFVNWVDINPNMIIKFTDNGFNGTAPNSQSTVGNARSTENFVIWKNNTGSAIAAGTVIKIESGTTTLGQIVSGGLTGIASGDQIFAYQGPATTGAFPDFALNTSAATTFSGNLLYGLNLQGGSGTATWLVPAAVTSANTSYLPSELAAANAAITIGGAATGSQYTGTRNALGTILAYKSLVNNPANWTNVTGSTLVTINTTAFTVNPNVATQLAVIGINGGVNPSTNTSFGVTVEVRDANGAPAAVGVDTDVTISLATGTGVLSGTLTGTITAGSGSLVITGVIYNVAEGGVTVTATATSGQSLTAATSSAFTVNETASQLVITGIESFVYTNNAIPTFSVEARTPSNVLDVNYNGTATISIVNGTGNLLGTVTKAVTAGVALFTDIAIDEPGTKQLAVVSGTLVADTSSNIIVSTATLTEVILPQFMQGQTTSSNPNRIPFAYRVTLDGLKPNSIYRYYNSVVIAGDGTTSNGAGNAIYAVQGGFVRSNATGLSTAGSYGEFTTSASGSYTGWFITEPTANASRFAPGTNVFPRIMINNGSGGTVVALRLTTANSVKVLSLGITAADGTGLRGNSSAAGQNFVFAYDNVEGTGRPLSGTFIESDGSDNSAANSYTAFYATDVNGVEGAYGMILPNTLASGVRRLEGRNFVTGELSGCASTDADGIWPSGTNTVNPITGLTAKVLTNADAPLVPSPEACDNYIDDDCDGLIDEACPGNFLNDAPGGATNILYDGLLVFPNCGSFTGNNTTANNSAESSVFDGPDSWFKFQAVSTGISITMASSTMDNAIAIYSRNGLVYTLIESENSSSVVGVSEKLNYGGLTIGEVYYVSFGAATGAGGTYSFCLQHLLPSVCASVAPVGGFNLCSSFKAAYRGSSTQGASYNFNFNGTGGGATGTTSISSSTGVISLSAPSLGLRYGGTYSVSIDMNYALTNGIGTVENILIAGSTSAANCSNVVIMNQPNVEVKSTQRCPDATLFRYSYLNAARVNNVPLCGPTSYTWVFRRMDDCSTPSPIAIDSILATTSSVYCQLYVLPNLPAAAGVWGVRVRPNFSYGSGTFGPERYINVNGTSASGQWISEEDVEAMRNSDETELANIYPNPSNGEFVNIVMNDVQSGPLQVRVLDAAGRAVTTRLYAIENAFNGTLVFEEKLTSGVYMVELNHSGNVKIQRLVVQ